MVWLSSWSCASGSTLLLYLFHARQRGGRVLARLSRRLPDLRVVLRQAGRRRADLIELAFERSGLRRSLFDLVFRFVELAPQLFEARAFFLEGVDRGLRLKRLRRQLLHGFAMPAELAVGADRLLRGLLGLARTVLERLDALVDLLEVFRTVVEGRNAPANLFEPGRNGCRLIGHLFELLTERREFGTPRGQCGQHGADGAALFARGGNQRLELAGLLLS